MGPNMHEQNLFVWVTLNILYFSFCILVVLIKKYKWASKRNATIGFRTIMALRSEKTWDLANFLFFRFWFYINAISLLVNVISFSLKKDFYLANNLSLKFFVLSSIILSILIEILLVIKFNWKGEPRNSEHDLS